MLAISATPPGLRPPPCNPSQAVNCVKANMLQMGIFYIGLCALGMGLAGVKSSVSALATDQFDHDDKKENTKMEFFLIDFTWSLILGPYWPLPYLFIYKTK